MMGQAHWRLTTISRRAQYAQNQKGESQNHTIEMNNAHAAINSIISAVYEQLAAGVTLAWCF